MPDARPIGVFDSGVGGLTVLREIIRRSPAESTIYLGDNARAPYGTRTDDEVLAFSTECLDRLAEHDVKAIVVACNTSTAVAIDALRRRYPTPIVGVIRPGAAAAALATRNGRIGVIATPATVRSHAYQRAIHDERAEVDIKEHPTPTLVPLVEAGDLTGVAVSAAVAQALAPFIDDTAANPDAIDTLLLGCTHYPLLRPVIASLVGDQVAIVDSATATASALAELLAVNRIDAPGERQPNHRQLTTGDPVSFGALAGRLFGEAVPAVEHIELPVAVR